MIKWQLCGEISKAKNEIIKFAQDKEDLCIREDVWRGK